MDRTASKSVIRVTIALLALAIAGPGCARMRKYRSQDAPLPGLPLIGRAKAKARRGQVDPAAAADPDAGRRASVAWSGEPNTAPIAARVAPKRVADAPAPRLSPDVPGVANRPSSGSAAIADAPKEVAPAVAKVRSLIQQGRDSMARVATYQVKVNGQERVNGTLQPDDEAILSIRREPKAIRLEWPQGDHKGREVIYSAAEPGGMIHVHVGNSMLPVPDLTLAADNPLVMRHSRHPITEAGLDSVLDRLDESLKPHEAGAPNGERFTYDGVRTPPEIGRACHALTRVTRDGETWVVSLDAETCLPAMVQATAANGALIERYLFRELSIDPPALADASAFDPEKRWSAGRGLLGRIAQGGANAPAAK